MFSELRLSHPAALWALSAVEMGGHLHCSARTHSDGGRASPVTDSQGNPVEHHSPMPKKKHPQECRKHAQKEKQAAISMLAAGARWESSV